MSWLAYHNAVRTKLADTLGEETLIIWDNAPDQTVPSTLHVQASILQGESNQITMGATGGRRFRTVGVLSVNIHAPMESGDATALALADTIRVAFQAVSVGGIHYRTPSMTRLGRQGVHYVVNVSCPFYADEVS